MQWLFSITLFLSATLLFLVQPMFARMVLPMLGGSPAVWNTCMVFYQAALLAGYVYAHLGIRRLGVRRQAVLHLVLLCLPWLVLPIAVAGRLAPPVDGSPVPWLLALLAVSVGLPFVVVSASAPMLQAWFARTGDSAAKDPYFLYAASNLGSMVALLGYPFLVEPTLSLRRQSILWAVGYGLLMVLIAACAAVLWRRAASETPRPELPAERRRGKHAPAQKRSKRPSREKAPARSEAAVGPSWLLKAQWLLLAMVPSSLLLGVTAHISTDIASVPLLWVVPLAIYLLTFVLVFARRVLFPHAWMVRVQAPLVLLLSVLFYHGLLNVLPSFWLCLHLGTFFVTAMVCHGELAGKRPESEQLTEFYLWISVGGVLGGAVNALVAPQVFSSIIEYPLMIAAACLLRPRTRSGDAERELRWTDVGFPVVVFVAIGGLLLGLELMQFMLSPGFRFCVLAAAAVAVFFFRRVPLRFALGVGAILLVGAMNFGASQIVIHAERNFFGVLRVTESDMPPSHTLLHGSTNHGVQWLGPDLRRLPNSYYFRDGPFGNVMDAMSEREHFQQIGVTGLGTGTIACYGKPGQRITFYEIDPATLRVARDPALFTYLADSQAEIDVVLGDARLRLEESPDGRFDLLVLDAFSSDALPMHLVMREAVALYVRKLAPDGVLLFNISNRYLDLEPVLGRIAGEAGLASRIRDETDVSAEEMASGKTGSTWVVMARSPEHLGKLLDDAQWEALAVDGPLWTDDFSNIVTVLK